MTMNKPKLALVAVVVILLVEITYGLIVWFLGRPQSVGIFGDMFGALNTFFAGLAFTGLVYTIYLQITESAVARDGQAASHRLIQQQVAALEEGLKRQTRRDRVEAGPFFKLEGNESTGGGVLTLQLKNVGAPVICLDFKCTTAECSVVGNQWRPGALASGEIFTAPTQIPPDRPANITYQMRLRDRWGEERTFELVLFSTYGGYVTFKEI